MEVDGGEVHALNYHQFAVEGDGYIHLIVSAGHGHDVMLDTTFGADQVAEFTTVLETHEESHTRAHAYESGAHVLFHSHKDHAHGDHPHGHAAHGAHGAHDHTHAPHDHSHPLHLHNHADHLGGIGIDADFDPESRVLTNDLKTIENVSQKVITEDGKEITAKTVNGKRQYKIPTGVESVKIIAAYKNGKVETLGVIGTNGKRVHLHVPKDDGHGHNHGNGHGGHDHKGEHHHAPAEEEFNTPEDNDYAPIDVRPKAAPIEIVPVSDVPLEEKKKPEGNALQSTMAFIAGGIASVFRRDDKKKKARDDNRAA